MENEKVKVKSWREDNIYFERGGVIEYTFKDTRPNNFIITPFFNQKPVRVSFDRNPNSTDYDYYLSGKNQYTISRPYGVSVIRINCANYGQKLRMCSYEGEYTPCFNMNTNEDIAVDISNNAIYTQKISATTADIRQVIQNLIPEMFQTQRSILNYSSGIMDAILNQKYGHFYYSHIKNINLTADETFDTNVLKTQIPITPDRDALTNIVYAKFGVNSTLNVGVKDSDTDNITFLSEETFYNFNTYCGRLRIQGPFTGIIRIDYT